MIKNFLLFVSVLLGLMSCSQDDSINVKWEGYWMVKGDHTEFSLNTLEWNIVNSRILHFTNDGVEFLNGFQYYPTRHFGFISPYKIQGDTLFIFYEPEGRFIEFLVKVHSRDSINVTRGSFDISMESIKLKEGFGVIDLGDIRSVRLGVKYDSLPNQEKLIDYDVVANVLDRTVKVMHEDGVRMVKQITPFETSYLLRQVKSIDFSQEKYGAVESDVASYVIEVETSSKDTMLELGDNTNTPVIIKGLVNFLDYLGKSN